MKFHHPPLQERIHGLVCVSDFRQEPPYRESGSFPARSTVKHLEFVWSLCRNCLMGGREKQSRGIVPGQHLLCLQVTQTDVTAGGKPNRDIHSDALAVASEFQNSAKILTNCQ